MNNFFHNRQGPVFAIDAMGGPLLPGLPVIGPGPGAVGGDMQAMADAAQAHTAEQFHKLLAADQKKTDDQSWGDFAMKAVHAIQTT